MPFPSDWITPLYLLVLCGFVAVTSTLMLLTVINWMRVQAVELMWRRGRVGGWPAAPTAFLSVVAVLMGLAAWSGRPLELTVLFGYLCGGAFWLMAASMTSAVLVTARGVVTHINRPTRAFAWAHVADYARSSQPDNGQRYVFFVREGPEQRRVEVRVPVQHVGAFQAEVEEHVDARFERRLHAVYGREALEE